MLHCKTLPGKSLTQRIFLVKITDSANQVAPFEQIVRETGNQLGTRVRGVGDYVHKEPGHVHMERGGPQGALVLFNIYAPEGEGKLAEALDQEGKVISVSTLSRILKKKQS